MNKLWLSAALSLALALSACLPAENLNTTYFPESAKSTLEGLTLPNTQTTSTQTTTTTVERVPGVIENLLIWKITPPGENPKTSYVLGSVSQSFKEGYEILISTMEHHSNIVPWQLACERKGARVVEIPVTDAGEIDSEAYDKLLESGRVKMVSMAHISNTLGTINPIKEFAKKAHAKGAHFCVDAAQSIAHMKVDVQDLGVDFLAFGAHKMFGPTGVGVLYGREELLNQMPPYRSGGAMIKEVTFEKTTFNDLPEKFEAGTPHIAGVNCLKAAIDYINEIGFEAIEAQEKELLDYATSEISKIEGVKIIGTAPHKASVLSFVVEGAHPHDIGMILDEQGVAIRTGHHCTQPLMKRYGVPATARASFSFYNNTEDVDRFISALKKAKDML